jgi:hypothetical protein
VKPATKPSKRNKKTKLTTINIIHFSHQSLLFYDSVCNRFQSARIFFLWMTRVAAPFRLPRDVALLILKPLVVEDWIYEDFPFSKN